MATTGTTWKIATLCGCAAASNGQIDYCRTHAAAPELAAELREALRLLERAATDEARANKAPTGLAPRTITRERWERACDLLAKTPTVRRAIAACRSALSRQAARESQLIGRWAFVDTGHAFVIRGRDWRTGLLRASAGGQSWWIPPALIEAARARGALRYLGAR
jgi:hypothetical protein